MADAEGVVTPIPRRERKRLETRNAIARAALEMFGEHGFENVTVGEIAERADVDASTFFRHFGSKEAVVFAEYSDFTGRLGTALRARPAKEQLFTAMKEAIKQLVTDMSVNVEAGFLTMLLSHKSPGIWAQSLVFREELVVDFANAIAERMNVDAQSDPRPYLVASTWIGAADWYREFHLRQNSAPATVQDAVDEIAEMVKTMLPILRGKP